MAPTATTILFFNISSPSPSDQLCFLYKYASRICFSESYTIILRLQKHCSGAFFLNFCTPAVISCQILQAHSDVALLTSHFSEYRKYENYIQWKHGR